MKFYKNVSPEAQKILTKQLKQYEREVKMNSKERQELHEWVAEGNSPYDNGNLIYVENGWPLDFITAMRLLNKHRDCFENLTKEEQDDFLANAMVYDTVVDGPVCRAAAFDHLYDDEKEGKANNEIDDELPF